MASSSAIALLSFALRCAAYQPAASRASRSLFRDFSMSASAPTTRRSSCLALLAKLFLPSKSKNSESRIECANRSSCFRSLSATTCSFTSSSIFSSAPPASLRASRQRKERAASRCALSSSSSRACLITVATLVFRCVNTRSLRGSPSPIASSRSSRNCFFAQARSATSRGDGGAGILFTESNFRSSSATCFGISSASRFASSRRFRRYQAANSSGGLMPFAKTPPRSAASRAVGGSIGCEAPAASMAK